MQASNRCEIIPIKCRNYSITVILVSCSLQEDKHGSEGISIHRHYWDSACVAMLLISSKCNWDKKLQPDENVTRKLNFSRCVASIHDISCSPMCLLNTRLFYAPLFTHIFALISFSSYMSILVLYLQWIKYKLLLQLLPSQAFILLVVPYLWENPAHMTQASRSIKCRGDMFFKNFLLIQQRQIKQWHSAGNFSVNVNFRSTHENTFCFLWFSSLYEELKREP